LRGAAPDGIGGSIAGGLIEYAGEQPPRQTAVRQTQKLETIQRGSDRDPFIQGLRDRGGDEPIQEDLPSHEEHRGRHSTVVERTPPDHFEMSMTAIMAGV
jgi:hypothetical protein